MHIDPLPQPAPRPRLRRRRIAWAAAALLLGAAGIVAGVAMARKPPPAAQTTLPPATLTVETVLPQRTTLSRSVAASGSIGARDELLVGSDASGVRLTEVLVDVGAQVKRGQLLARGDDAVLRSQLAQYEAMRRQAEAEWAQARANLERAERVQDAGVYSVEALQTRRTGADAAAAKLDLVRAQLQELELHLAHTRVVAPADGVIARRSATVGAVMQPGQELFRLLRNGEIEWLAELPAAALAEVRAGAAARLRLDDGRWIEGRVRLVAPTIDARTRNGIAYVQLTEAPAALALRAGGHASGEIVIGDAQVWTLPESVVHVRDGESHVWLVGADGVARRTRVATGVRQHGRVEVQGLDADARVVSTGGGFVKDGERVHVAAPVTVNQGAST